MSTISPTVPAWGAGAMTLTRSLKVWRRDRRRSCPEIITEAWEGTKLDKKLVDIWWKPYAYTYSCMTALKCTGDLWATYERLACQVLPESGLVLDAGCGTARTVVALLDSLPAIRVVGFDWSPHFLRQAQKNLAKVQYEGRVGLWRVDLAQEWPWPSESCDGVTAHCVLPYLPRLSQITILEQAYRVLMPGSVFLVDYMRAGFTFREIVRHVLLSEFLANPLVLLKALLIIPVFTKRADRARAADLTYDFSDAEFRTVVDGIGYRSAEIIDESLNGPNGPSVPIWKLTK